MKSLYGVYKYRPADKYCKKPCHFWFVGGPFPHWSDGCTGFRWHGTLAEARKLAAQIGGKPKKLPREGV